VRGRERIGRYEVLRLLASGGMAEVFLCRLTGPGGFGRVAAVKRILPHLARSEEFVSMFLDEARIVARLHHPNVVQVYDLGVNRGQLYMAMEFLEGATSGSLLAASRDTTPLPLGLASHIVAEACAGLQAAHELRDTEGKEVGLVHRDVSPQNIFVTADGRIKLIDFGVAIVSERLARTDVGKLKGKFPYMSPEQCLGLRLDRRSDLFALGAVLYELTVGRALFKRSSELGVVRAICDEPIIPPTRVVDGYPKALEVVVMKALARSRPDRYASAAAMHEDLVPVVRELLPGRDPAEMLARTMTDLFGKTLAQARQELRTQLALTPLAHLRSRRAIWAAGVASGVALLVAGGWWARRPAAPLPTASCGDGICASSRDENCLTCARDCGTCGKPMCDSTPGEWKACRGTGCSVCAEMLKDFPHYVEHHPSCIEHKVCFGVYYECNARCPEPTDADR
jgi:hypothetical protein